MVLSDLYSVRTVKDLSQTVIDNFKVLCNDFNSKEFMMNTSSF